MSSLRNFNKKSRKDMAYDNMKKHKKTVLYLLCRRYTFGKATGERGQIDHPFPHWSIFLSVKIYLGNLQDVSEKVLAFLNKTS